MLLAAHIALNKVLDHVGKKGVRPQNPIQIKVRQRPPLRHPPNAPRLSLSLTLSTVARASMPHMSRRKMRGCTLAGSKVVKQMKDRKSVIFGVWAAPGAPETRPKGGGRSPPPFGRFSGAPGATHFEAPDELLVALYRQHVVDVHPHARLGPGPPQCLK